MGLVKAFIKPAPAIGAAFRVVQRMASGAASSAIDPAQLEGGYAGWEARWSLATGKPKTVPDHYLPESFKEWEVDVWGLELQAFDRLVKKGSAQQLQRVAARYMVEAGCGCENVGKEVFRRTYDEEEGGLFVVADGEAGYVGVERLGEKLLRLEHGFVVVEEESAGEEGASPVQRRARVLVDYDASSGGLRGEAVVQWERRWSGVEGVDPVKDNPFRDPIDTASLRQRIGSPCFSEPEHLAKHEAEASGLPSSPRLVKRQAVSGRQAAEASAPLPPHIRMPGGLTLGFSQQGPSLLVEVGLWRAGRGRVWRSWLAGHGQDPPSASVEACEHCIYEAM